MVHEKNPYIIKNIKYNYMMLYLFPPTFQIPNSQEYMNKMFILLGSKIWQK